MHTNHPARRCDAALLNVTPHDCGPKMYAELLRLQNIFEPSQRKYGIIWEKLADHVGNHVVLFPEGAVLVTFPGTESPYPRPPHSLNDLEANSTAFINISRPFSQASTRSGVQSQSVRARRDATLFVRLVPFSRYSINARSGDIISAM